MIHHPPNDKLTVITPRTLMTRRLASRTFPTANTRIVAYAIVRNLAIGIDPDGLRGRVRLSLRSIMAASTLPQDAAYEAVDWLVGVGFLVELDDAMDRDFITYGVDVRALPMVGQGEEREAA